jgi:ATP-dependent DNA helicase RecG
MHPDDEIARHFRLVPTQLTALRKLRLRTLGDLLYHFPVRYESAGADGQARTLIPKTKVTLIGTLSKLEAKKLWKSRRTATEGRFEDATGSVKVLWFNQPYIAKMAPQGVPMKLTGTVGGTAEKPYIINPEVVAIGALETMTGGLFAAPESGDEAPPRLFPVYPESAGITSRWFYHTISKLIEYKLHLELRDAIPVETRERLHLPELAAAMVWMHVPDELKHTEAARKRFAFEEIFVLQVAQALERKENAAESSISLSDPESRIDTFIASVGMTPTGAQARAITEIANDLAAPHPMARLVEGDVGSGKTLVAAAAAYAAVTARPKGRVSGTLQVAYMAPTEILAQQHFESFIRYFRDLPISIGLITGSGCKKFPSKTARGGATTISRTQLLKWAENGEIALLIGTHALIQKSVRFKHLALAIVDEQHRFGTRQRRELAQKNCSAGGRAESDAVRGAGKAGKEPYISTVTNTPGPRNDEMRRFRTPTPHFLSMTATPIPRTLALTIYGDLDLSVIDELPPGRQKVTTKLIQEKGRAEMYEEMRRELAAGRQAYVICPRIDEPDPEKMNALMAKSAKAEAKRLEKDVFPEYAVGLLHGAMTPAEKDAAMRAFEKNETQILVATSVVEVGVNVANATVIVIEGAERFGLSQLHQLRGRVQRSSHKPHCFLAPDTTSALSLKRLRALEKSSDGFELAEADLALRGAGDLYGTQQWGVSDIGMEALKNPRLIEAARTEARMIVAQDPALSKHAALALRAARAASRLHAE